MIVFLRSTDGNPDSRLQKYTSVLTKEQVPFHAFCWDRSGKFANGKVYTFYHKQAFYGSGLKNVVKLIGFNWFLLKNLIKKRKTYKTIHACDFDTILPGLFMKLFFRKKLIYDIFDWYADSRELRNVFLKSLILFIEFLNIKIADVTIICEEERIKQIQYSPKRLWILPNIPYFQNTENTFTDRLSGRIILSYVGILSRYRGLEKILDFISNNPDIITFEIAGFGELEDMVEKYSNCLKNIHYHGKVSYENGLEIMRKSDLILAIYEKSIPNHIYAAPNKYYEGLYLGKPILTTKGTYVGLKTENNRTGFVIDETIGSIKKFFFQEGLKDSMTMYGKNARRLWEEKYIHYVDTFMQDHYLPFIKEN